MYGCHDTTGRLFCIRRPDWKHFFVLISSFGGFHLSSFTPDEIELFFININNGSCENLRMRIFFLSLFMSDMNFSDRLSFIHYSFMPNWPNGAALK